MRIESLSTCKVCLSKVSSLVNILIILGRFSDEEERNIILLRLLDYLGHSNPYICAVAYNEVRSFLAWSKPKTYPLY